MKKYIAALLAFVMLFSMAGCEKASAILHEGDTSDEMSTVQAIDEDVFKVAFILPAEGEAPDTESREDAIRKMQYETGLTDDQVTIYENISRDKCPEVLEILRKKKCNMIFALGTRYEDAVIEAAQNNPQIQYCLEGGRASIDAGLANVHTFNSRIYEAYYVAGVAAGMKINELLNAGRVSPYDCRIGFVAYKEAPETTTCINAFYLGVKKMNSSASISVRYVGKRGDYDADGECARQLAASGVGLMCQYTFTTAVAAVCAENEIPVIGNEDNIINIAPNMAITSTYTDWSVYYTKAVNAAIQGSEIPNDWCGGYKEGVVRLSQLNDQRLADNTANRLAEVEEELRAGNMKIFDLEAMYKNGESFASQLAYNENFAKYNDYIADGELKEQSKMSSPIFEDFIDGISVSTENYIPEEPAEETSTEEGLAEGEQ